MHRKEHSNPIPFSQVLKEEREALQLTSQIGGEDQTTAALCFSGGGIRSATFCLGVLQGLAKHGVLGHFHYLSTVSGGGYIGSWLSAWMIRNGREPVIKELGGKAKPDPDAVEPKPVAHLRTYSNYLTPRLGVLSTDTWTLIGTYSRNLLLNWMVMLPVLLAITALPRVMVSALAWRPPAWVMALFVFSGLTLLLLALCYSVVNRISASHQDDLNKLHDRGWFLGLFAVPLPLAASLLTLAWSWLNHATAEDKPLGWWVSLLCPQDPVGLAGLYNLCLVALTIALLVWLLEWFSPLCRNVIVWLREWFSLLSQKPIKPREDHYRGDDGVQAAGATVQDSICTKIKQGFLQCRLAFGRLVSLALAACAAGLLVYGLTKTVQGRLDDYPVRELYAAFGVPLLLLSVLLGATMHVGLSCKVTSEDDREWWARLGASVLLVIVGWSVFNSLVIFLPVALLRFPEWLSTLGGVTGLLTLWLGKRFSTPQNGDTKTSGGTPQLVAAWTLKVAAPVFAALLVGGLSLLGGTWLKSLGSALASLTERMRAAPQPQLWRVNEGIEGANPFIEIIHHAPPLTVFVFALLAIMTGLVVSWFININKFSLHGTYRNRLVRAYLGASKDRQPNPLTDFDPRDNVRLPDLNGQRPLQIVNMAINLTAGQQLAWQQRKAASFTASALHCGTSLLGYRPTSEYAQNRRNHQGLSLGTAMTISGAAASPNMGLHTSSLVSLIMMIFNVRLGAWLGNPGPAGQDTYMRDAPRYGSLSLLMQELLGRTSAKGPYVYLSDGGHFENLGIYEMVRRRCEMIVACDAECDLKFRFEGLGNALRKVRSDLGVDIRFEKDSFNIFAPHDPRNRSGQGAYFAIGTIHYPAADGGEPRDGTLVYIKPTLLGSEPMDVFNYAQVGKKQFPHETTADQWFSESQFESYRALGRHIIGTMCEPPTTPQDIPPPFTWGNFVRNLKAKTGRAVVPRTKAEAVGSSDNA